MGRRGSQSNGKFLESDMMCFSFLKGHSGCFVGKDYKGTRTEEGRSIHTGSQLCRDMQRQLGVLTLSEAKGLALQLHYLINPHNSPRRWTLILSTVYREG